MVAVSWNLQTTLISITWVFFCLSLFYPYQKFLSNFFQKVGRRRPEVLLSALIVFQDGFEVLVGLIYTHPAGAHLGFDRAGGHPRFHVCIGTLDARPVGARQGLDMGPVPHGHQENESDKSNRRR